MAYWKENQDLSDLQRETEERVREMKRQLEMGFEEAESEFESSRAELKTAAKASIAEIESLAGDAGDELQAVGRKLGELNYLLAEEKIEDVDTLESLREGIVEQMDEARTCFREAEARARGRLHESEGRLQAAWERFQRCLELLRVHMAEVSSDAKERFADERRRLEQRLLEKSTEPGTMEEAARKLSESIEEHKRWIIAFFQSPLEATPHPPKPGEGTIHPTHERHTGA